VVLEQQRIAFAHQNFAEIGGKSARLCSEKLTISLWFAIAQTTPVLSTAACPVR
jgi:hypothetical protein